MVTSVIALGRQRMSRFSSRVTPVSATIARIARMSIAAYTPFALKVPWAVAIIRPTPLRAPRYSPTIAPTRAKPKLVCRLAVIHDHANRQAKDRLLARDCDLLPERPLCRPVLHPPHQLIPDARGLPEEDLVDHARCGVVAIAADAGPGFPDAHDDHGQCDAQENDEQTTSIPRSLARGVVIESVRDPIGRER